jgi:hypothetical protein
VWLEAPGVGLKPGQAFVVLPGKVGETENSPAGFLAPLRTALVDENTGHVIVFVCEEDYRELKRGIGNLAAGVQ